MKKQSQIKPNFRKARMNVTSILTKYYENAPLRSGYKAVTLMKENYTNINRQLTHREMSV